MKHIFVKNDVILKNIGPAQISSGAEVCRASHCFGNAREDLPLPVLVGNVTSTHEPLMHLQFVFNPGL